MWVEEMTSAMSYVGGGKSQSQPTSLMTQGHSMSDQFGGKTKKTKTEETESTASRVHTISKLGPYLR